MFCSEMNGTSARDVNFRPRLNEFNRDYSSHPLHFEFFAQFYMSLRNNVMNNYQSSIEQNQSRESSPKFFVGSLKIYTDKLATTCKSKSFGGYPIHVNILNVSVQSRPFLIDHGHNLVFLLGYRYHRHGKAYRNTAVIVTKTGRKLL